LVTAIVHAAFPTRVTNRFQDCTHLDRIPIGNHSEHPFQRPDFERCLKSSVPASIMVTASGFCPDHYRPLVEGRKSDEPAVHNSTSSD
jgi:hypothetical protein